MGVRGDCHKAPAGQKQRVDRKWVWPGPVRLTTSDPLPPSRLQFLKVLQSSKIAASARNEEFKHISLWETTRIQAMEASYSLISLQGHTHVLVYHNPTSRNMNLWIRVSTHIRMDRHTDKKYLLGQTSFSVEPVKESAVHSSYSEQAGWKQRLFRCCSLTQEQVHHIYLQSTA